MLAAIPLSTMAQSEEPDSIKKPNVINFVMQKYEYGGYIKIRLGNNDLHF